jgi:hypothetical protein
MHDFITAPTHEERLRYAVSAAWEIFSRKVGGKTIPVNKEASMQLQYAYILRQLIPLTSHSCHEVADIELETGVKTKNGTSEIDILLKGESTKGKFSIAIELKCYREITSSGGLRGANDLFMKDVYEDLGILEEYVSRGHANRGVSLVMNDLKRFVHPKTKKGKCWAYDISNGHSISGKTLSVPMGGKEIYIELQKSYQFNWSEFGGFWFMELEGV